MFESNYRMFICGKRSAKFSQAMLGDRTVYILHATDHEDSNENDDGRG